MAFRIEFTPRAQRDLELSPQLGKDLMRRHRRSRFRLS